MGKLSRFTQYIFGQNATANQISEFGSLANSTPTTYSGTTVTPALAMGLISLFQSGWFSAVTGANSPAIEDMNSIFYVIFFQLCYLMQTGIAEWDSGTTYFAGSLCTAVGTGVIYTCINDNSGTGITNQALSNATYWAPQSGNETGTNTSYTVKATDDMLLLAGNLSTFTATLPALTSVPIGKTYYFKYVVGTHVATISGNGSDQIEGSGTYVMPNTLYSYVILKNAGNMWWIIGSATG